MNAPQPKQAPIIDKRLLNLVFLCSLLVGICNGCVKPQPATVTTVPTSNTSGSTSPVSDLTEVPQVPEGTTTNPADVPKFKPAPEGKVLRHAVFFSFKEESSEEDIQGVVDAFRELPEKIAEISDFKWGVNNSPEELNDGFTHCFLLTFKNEADRAAYIPHEAHKAFGDVLRPHKDKVFVLDYWGDANAKPLKRELKHAVFLRFKWDASLEDIQKVEAAFAALPAKIDTIRRFEWGINNSPERHAAGFTHCFMVGFGSEEGRATYLPHPDHLAFIEILKPVLDAPRVLDFWAEE